VVSVLGIEFRAEAWLKGPDGWGRIEFFGVLLFVQDDGRDDWLRMIAKRTSSG
jgi:hypothetical protein